VPAKGIPREGRQKKKARQENHLAKKSIRGQKTREAFRASATRGGSSGGTVGSEKRKEGGAQSRAPQRGMKERSHIKSKK